MRNVTNRIVSSRDKRRNLGSVRVKRKARTAIPVGDLRETVYFYETGTSFQISSGGARKSLDIAFEAKAKVEEVSEAQRTFQNINVEDVDITHRITIRHRTVARDEMFIKWNDDLFEIVRKTRFRAQYSLWDTFSCRLSGDLLLEASKA